MVPAHQKWMLTGIGRAIPLKYLVSTFNRSADRGEDGEGSQR
jgi:hypothetical protein